MCCSGSHYLRMPGWTHLTGAFFRCAQVTTAIAVCVMFESSRRRRAAVASAGSKGEQFFAAVAGAEDQLLAQIHMPSKVEQNAPVIAGLVLVCKRTSLPGIVTCRGVRPW